MSLDTTFPQLSEGYKKDKPCDLLIESVKSSFRKRSARGIYEAEFIEGDFGNFSGWRFSGDKSIVQNERKTKLEIYVKGKRIKIPNEIKGELLRLLLDPSTHILDCRRFAGIIGGYKKNEIQAEKLNIKNDTQFQAGKVYGLVNLNQETQYLGNGPNGGEYHFFIYLGGGLFISKPGRNAEIIITTFDELKKGCAKYEQLYEVI